MIKFRYSAENLCSMYPDKYIAVNRIELNDYNIIVSAEVLKVYDTLDDCKSHIDELKLFKALYKDDFDVIYGDYEDYIRTRRSVDGVREQYSNEVIKDAFEFSGFISFGLF